MKLESLAHDLKASVVVFLVALPLCLGIALASNAPLSSGLIAGMIGGILVGAVSHSQISVSGPAAGLTVIVANGIVQLGGIENFGMAVFLAGIIQLIFGLLKGGVIGDYFPAAVIKGMLAAIGLILIMKQLPVALGATKGKWEISLVNQGILAISSVSLLIMLVWEKLALKKLAFFKLIPGPLVAVVASILLNHYLGLVDKDHLVQLPASLFSEIRLPRFSSFDFDIAQVAITIAIVASLETLLCIDAADKIDPLKRTTNKNRELFAQGLGNSLSGLFGGLPLTAVIVRTSANVAAGARFKLSSVFHGVWLFLCVLLIPGILNMIPLATLACVLLLVGYKLTKPAFFLDMWRRGVDQLAVFCTTIGAILLTDLLLGILVGFILALIMEIRRPGINSVEVHHENDKVHIRFVKDVSFLQKAMISKLLNEVPPGKSIHFHGMKLVRLHVDVHELILDFRTQNQAVEVIFI